MTKIADTFDFGNEGELSQEDLLRYLQTMYTTLATAINQRPSVYERNTDGQVSDTFLSNGDLNINTNTLKVEMLTKHNTSTTVTWTTLS